MSRVAGREILAWAVVLAALLVAFYASIFRINAPDLGWHLMNGAYMAEQCAMGEHANMPGAAIYERREDAIVRRGQTAFGPGDLYSPLWHFLALAGVGAGDWSAQFHYWSRPEKLDDGGENVRD